MNYHSNPKLSEIAEKLECLDRLVLWIVAGATTYYTFEGITKLFAGADQLARAGYALFALAVGTGLYLLWRKLLAVTPLLVRKKRRRALAMAALICFFAIGTSSFLNLTGIEGDEALMRHMQMTTEQFSDAAASVDTQAKAALAGVAALHLNVAKFEELAGAERQGGTSGVPGIGAVASMYGQIASVMQAAEKEAENKVTQIDAYTQENQKQLAAMREALADPKSNLAERTSRFAAAAEALRTSLVAESALEITSTIRAAVRAAREAVPQVLSGNGVVAERQRAAVVQLADNLHHLDSLTAVADEKRPEPLLSRAFHPISVYEAVARHVLDFAPLALAVLLADLVPSLLLLLNIIMQDGLDGEGQGDAVLNLRVADLLAARDAEALLAAHRRAADRPHDLQVPPERRLPPPQVVWRRPE